MSDTSDEPKGCMSINCANCGKEIREGDLCVIVKDNVLLREYFEARGYVFCDTDCLMGYLSADEQGWED